MPAGLLERVRRVLTGRLGCDCDRCPMAGPDLTRRVLLFGAPNVGKSVLFNRLTGSYVTVSNYPGTTVEVSRGRARLPAGIVHVTDVPGTYSLLPNAEDEQVARDLLLEEGADIVVHVVAAKNLSRMLPLTLQLIEAGLPVALDMNIMDEAERAGIAADPGTLGRRLGIPVVATSAVTNQGVDKLRSLLTSSPPPVSRLRVAYPIQIESAVAEISALVTGDYGISKRGLALLLLQRDAAIRERVAEVDPEALAEIDRIVARTQESTAQPSGLLIAVARQRVAESIAKEAMNGVRHARGPAFAEVLNRLTMHPVAGLLILLGVLYFGFYLLVGKLGAGALVDLLDKRLFEGHINPAAESLAHKVLPWPTWANLFVGEFGLVTLGLRYAFAIVLPLVGIFFLVFAVLEDSGYLPRLALLVDRLFKRIGLSGRAVIPVVLGFGCDTMATLVTRTLETRRERLIATFLLALAIPCSAQLGVILGMLSGHPLGLAIWMGVIAGVFLLTGALAARVLPGGTARFHLEIPPLRWPALRNVATKTFARVRWYAAEVIPLFLLASVILWVGQLTGIFGVAVRAMRPLVNAIGLPDSAAEAFLFGFFRRDYGAARIFDTHSSGALSGVPLVVSMVTITLFIPCIAQFLVMQKERGLRTALAVTAIIMPFAFGVGYLLNLLLTGLKVTI